MRRPLIIAAVSFLAVMIAIVLTDDDDGGNIGPALRAIGKLLQAF
jgi:hypothetical protein